MQSTTILKVVIESGSAKVREGVPSDEKADLEDEGTLGRVWTGVLPVYEVVGEPVEGPYNRVEGVPGYVEEWRGKVNEGNRGYAVSAAAKDAPVARKERGDEDDV